MHNTALVFCFWEGCSNRFLKPCESVRAEDKNILDATVLKTVQNTQPVFTVFIFTDFKGEYFFVAILIDAEHNICSQLADNTVVTYRKMNGVNKDNRIDAGKWPTLPLFNLEQNFVKLRP